MREARPSGVGASRWRTLLVLIVATLTPLLIYVLVSTAIGYRDDRRATEAATLARAVRVMDSVDSRLDAVSATMRALATIRSIGQRNWGQARERAAEIARLDPDWRNVVIADATGKVLVDLRAAGGQANKLPARDLRAAGPTPSFSGIQAGADGRPAILADLRVTAGGGAVYVLRVELDPVIVQRTLVATAPTEGVSAVVDRQGLFIARTKAWGERVGRPATRYVRAAMRFGRSGVYAGVTYEGLQNFSAFSTSARTGWSAHVAVSAAVMDRPTYGWRVTAGLAGLAALALALALIILILRLVTARREADQRVQQTERLEAVGKLTGGIAHDFNNMLAIVIGSLDLAQRRLASGNTDIVKYIDNAMDGAHRAADLTRRLLAFSRRQPLAPVPVDVNALILTTGELLRRTLAADVTVAMVLEPDLWATFVDSGQLENALVNLAVNARDAMPHGGKLTIATENRPVPTEMVAITVTDTGEGMAADVAARAFEPFFTTKDVGRGTGLGLSQIHGFVTQSGGSASIRSAPGRGAAVTLLLPRYRGAGDPVAGAAADDQVAPPGRPDEIVLIVEDEERVRATNVEALRTLGYTVRHASGAQDALDLLETQPGIRLMLTDIVMPGMNGRDLAARVGQRHPDVRIVLTTGYEREEPAADESEILRKPFGIGELARRVRHELDRAA